MNVSVAANAKRLPMSAIAPKVTSPITAPSTPAARNQPEADARIDVGKSSLTSAPTAGAKIEPNMTPIT